MSGGINFYILDLETNGLMRGGYHQICELSIIRASDRMQLTRQIKVDKVENSSWDALKIIGKSMNDLRQGIPLGQMVLEVEKFLQEDKSQPSHRCLCGHNIVNFDRPWLWDMWKKYNKEFPFDLYLDTMHMFKSYIKKNGIDSKSKLDVACDVMGITKLGKAHTAKSDTQNTYLLWQELNKHIDFLPHIKNLPHRLSSFDE